MALKLFGSHISQRAAMRKRVVRGIHLHGQPKITQDYLFRSTLWTPKEHIQRFKIAMDHSTLVSILHRSAKLAKKRAGGRKRERATGRQALLQITTARVFTHHIKEHRAVRRVNQFHLQTLIDAQYVWVLPVRNLGRLFHKAV